MSLIIQNTTAARTVDLERAAAWVYDYLDIRRPLPIKVRNLGASYLYAYAGRIYYGRHIVCRLARRYPVLATQYERRDGPPPWVAENIMEAFVGVLAHEAMHERQRQLRLPARESECDWSAYRLAMEWRAIQAKKAARKAVAS